MLFTSDIFHVFLIAVFAVYYLVPGKWQIRWLILASLFFYAYGQPYLLSLLLISAGIDAFVSWKILAFEKPRTWATIGVACNLSILAFFKYGGLFASSFAGLFDADISLTRLLAIPLPVGISFYTFHGVSLLVDAYRSGQTRRDVSHADKLSSHLQSTLLYVSFFPQLIAGPIVKAHVFYPQIGRKNFRDIDWDNAVGALIVGFFLKAFVADNLDMFTNKIVYPWFQLYSSRTLAVMACGYAVQIFADFAGYSLIAIGLAKLFGYNLPVNFNFPYISESFSELWTRWHISLSTWLRDYLYFPLGGNRKGKFRTYANLMIVMGLGGLWHGAAWGYAIWGLWNGAALCIERMFRGSWFYRAENLAIRVLRVMVVLVVWVLGLAIFKLRGHRDIIAFAEFVFSHANARWNPYIILMIAVYGLPVVLYHLHYLWQRRCKALGKSYPLGGMNRRILLGVLMAAAILNPGPPISFIYFQF